MALARWTPWERSCLLASPAAGGEDMEVGNNYKRSSVNVDGKQFENCTFEDCKLVYSGGEPPSFVNCTFTANLDLVFDGAAGNTVQFLKVMASPKSGMQSLVAQIFPALG